MKPNTMADLPSSDSEDSEKNDTYKGLSNASIYLGEGAIMYLQTMKTLAILFFILSILNIPIYLMYASSTIGNQYGNLDEIFKYFTVGNIEQTNTVCGHTTIDGPSIELKCPSTGYMSSIDEFGLLYMLDYVTGRISHPITECKQVDPLGYKDQSLPDSIKG